MLSSTLVLLVTGLTCVRTQHTLEEKKSVNKVLTAGTHGRQGKKMVIQQNQLICLEFFMPHNQMHFNEEK